MMKNNIYVVVTHPIQYFVPLYQEIAKDDEINLTVFYCTEETVKGGFDQHFGLNIKWDIPLLDGYNYQFLQNQSRKPSLNNGFWGIINLGIIAKLFQAPKGLVIVSGWMNITYILALVFGRLFGHRVSIRCEAPYFKEMNRPKSYKNFIRAYLLKNFLFRLFVDFYLYIGSQNKIFYQHYGAKESQLIFTPYSVDNKRFQDAHKCLSKTQLRQEFNIGENDFVVLFSGKLYEVKRPFDLIDSFLALDISKKQLCIVGDGILRPKIEDYINSKNISNIELFGFQNQTEIPKFYQMADVLVLCSESETWGLSVNEAMNFGLPVIVYDSVGCAEDLVVSGQNGYIVPGYNIVELSEALKNVASIENFSRQAERVSFQIISNFSYSKVIQGLKQIFLT